MPSLCPSDTRWGEAAFWGADGGPRPEQAHGTLQPGTAGPTAARPWQEVAPGWEPAMERGSSCPSSCRRGQHGVVSPGHPGPCCLRPCGVTLHSCLGLCKASDQSISGGVNNPRSHPGKRHRDTSQAQPQQRPSQGYKSWGRCCPQSLWFGWLWCSGMWGWGCRGNPPATPGGDTLPSKDQLLGIPEPFEHRSSAKGGVNELPTHPISAGLNAGSFWTCHGDREPAGRLLLGVNRGFC